jgi:hypothetical protein
MVVFVTNIIIVHSVSVNQDLEDITVRKVMVITTEFREQIKKKLFVY